MGTKNNPGKFDCYTAAKPDEPMFVLLGRDPYAPALVRAWANMRAEMEPSNDGEKQTEAREVAYQMERYLKELGKPVVEMEVGFFGKHKVG